MSIQSFIWMGTILWQTFSGRSPSVKWKIGLRNATAQMGMSRTGSRGLLYASSSSWWLPHLLNELKTSSLNWKALFSGFGLIFFPAVPNVWPGSLMLSACAYDVTVFMISPNYLPCLQGWRIKNRWSERLRRKSKAFKAKRSSDWTMGWWMWKSQPLCPLANQHVAWLVFRRLYRS